LKNLSPKPLTDRRNIGKSLRRSFLIEQEHYNPERTRMTPNSSYALVTAGGTSVYLDRVRKLTNDSKGAFGSVIANVLYERGIEVVLLCTEQTKYKYPILRGVTVVLYDSYDDYVRKIEEIVAQRGKPSFAFSSAAVSDAGPNVVAEGKLSSKEAYSVRFNPLPKVIQSWREQFGRACYLVGYKLHDTSSNLDKLLADAKEQNRTASMNLTVANFKPWQSPSTGRVHKRTVYLVKPDGGYLTLTGTLSEISNQLVTFVLRQAQTHWTTSQRMGSIQMFTTETLKNRTMDETLKLAENVLEVAQEANLLNGSPGNVVVSDEARKYLLVTPRAFPHKETLRVRDMVVVDRDFNSDVLRYWSEEGVKPSIDSHVYALVFRNVRNIRAAIHFHEGWVLDAWQTRHDYPCGTTEEASMILEGLARTSIRHAREATSPPWVIIELVRHGYILFLNDHPYAYDTLRNAVADNYEQYALHLMDIGKVLDLNTFRLMPIFGQHGTIIGTVAQHREEGWCSFYIDPMYRGRRNGTDLVRFINERGITVGVHADCNIELFYRSYGFKVRERREDGLIILDPPALANDLVDVAMVSIRSAQTGKFLQIARTETSIFTKQWSNPAGVVNEGESVWDAAVRIAIDQIGFDFNHLPEPDEQHRSNFFCSDLADDAQNDRRMRITAYQVDVHDEFAPFLDPDHARDFNWRSAIEIRSVRGAAESTREAARLHEETIRLELRKYDL